MRVEYAVLPFLHEDTGNENVVTMILAVYQYSDHETYHELCLSEQPDLVEAGIGLVSGYR